MLLYKGIYCRLKFLPYLSIKLDKLLKKFSYSEEEICRHKLQAIFLS